jgi:hypothetical protein
MPRNAIEENLIGLDRTRQGMTLGRLRGIVRADAVIE